MDLGWKIALGIVGCLFVSYLVGCVTNSEGRKTLKIVSASQMTSLGEESYRDILQKAKSSGTLVSPGSPQYEAVERIGRRIASASGADLAWEFSVINEPETVNAFCLPGGKIAVYTGIFPVAQTEEALAAIMGHEVAHATLQHGAERVSQQLALAGLVAAADMSVHDSQYRNLILGSLGLGAQFGVILPFSRGHESEADKVGLRYAAAAGYRPDAAIGLWERMGAKGKSPPEFMSTHPDPANRRRALAEMQADVAHLYAQSDKQPERKLPY